MSDGQKLTLSDVLYIPSSDVRLISVHALNAAGNYVSHFDTQSCWVTDRFDNVVARGHVLPARNLYVFPSSSPRVSCSPSVSHSAHLARRVPNVASWHLRLGHLNQGTIVEMARAKVVQGMPINLSTSPPKCDPCILGKQTRSSVPKTREGERATRPLERVFLDLCGPMSFTSRSGRLYSMNVIDDYSNYVWSIPLRSKDEALILFRDWHAAVENQSGYRLTYLITDNGELASNSMKAYCSQRGITHLFTAPYTSAHNGRAERLHRTIFEKARTMRFACKAPPSMWDEFCATAAFLTNLSASAPLNGRTPYEFWFNRLPSLSHLREIGCRAYALIHSHNPKLLPRSVPCIMIGYGSHTKAYRLWDPVTDKIFNSFHVTFIEHLDAESVPLLPNTILGTDTADVPGSWDAPTIPSPTDHSSNDLNNPHPQLPTPSSHPISCPISPPPRSPSTQNTINSTQNTINSESQTTQSRIPQANIQNRHDQHRNYDTVDRSHINNPNNNQNTDTNNPNNSPSTPTPNNTTFPTPANQPPPPRRSSRIPIPSARGLQPSSRLTAIQQEIADSAARRQESRNAPPTVSLAYAFISEYSPVRESHDLFPLSLSPDLLSHSLDSALSSLSDGTIVPAPESSDDPLWSEALVSPEREYWIAGARDELHSLEDLQVFVLVPRSDVPRGQRPLKGKLVCKRKRDDAGNVVRYKVRYVAKGYTQRYGVDYEKTTAPTARLESFRALLHLGASRDWDIQQYDIKTAFLHGVLPTSETMFMEQPPGFEAPGKQDWVMKLMKSIYGMKQASRVWNKTFDESVRAWGFQRVPCEWCVYHRSSETGTIIFAVHVDDIISIASSAEENNRFKSDLDAKWKISDLGEAKFALGIAMTRDRPNRTISLSQTALIDRIVSDFGQSDA